MASIWKHPESKYWHANFTLPGGGRTNRSTRETDSRKAQKIADEYESVAQRRMTEGQIRRVMTDLFERVSGTNLPSASAREFLTGWIERKRVENGEKTAERYQTIVQRLLDALGDRADRELLFVTAKDIVRFRDEAAKNLSVSSTNLALKVIRMAFQQAFRDGVISENPATRVTAIKRTGEGASRRAFTLDELSRLLAESSGEWRGMIMFGLYTGQRMGDLARLTWQNIHGLGSKSPELRLVTGKTGRQQIIPLAKPLQRFVEDELTAGDDPRAALFPRLLSKVEKQSGRSGALSGEFYRIMADAGLVPARTNKAQDGGDGRSGKRTTNELSFHCLRHTATSLMKNAGISPAVVQDIIGHESAAVSAHYTHIESDVKRTALDSLPDLAVKECTNPRVKKPRTSI